MILLCMDILENYFVAFNYMFYKVVAYIDVLGLAIFGRVVIGRKVAEWWARRKELQQVVR